MPLTRSLIVMVLLAVALSLSACAGGPGLSAELYPSPRPGDLPVGIDEGLVYRDWDGGHPLRIFAFLFHPLGILADLVINQPAYILASKAPDFFGYTVQDEVHRQRHIQYTFGWDNFTRRAARAVE
jgi:hypothetical protein